MGIKKPDERYRERTMIGNDTMGRRIEVGTDTRMKRREAWGKDDDWELDDGKEGSTSGRE